MPREFKAPQAFSDKPYNLIAMALVESNQIACIGYEPATKTLAVQFSRGPGHIYHYPSVEQETFDAFMASESKGGFFKDHIKDLAFDKFPVPEGNCSGQPRPVVESSESV